MKLEYVPFCSCPPGTLLDLLRDAYDTETNLMRKDAPDWAAFDRFVYANLAFMADCGFITMLRGSPVGFVSWDPRHLPAYVRIGHNCVRSRVKGRGIGSAQLGNALKRIREQMPVEIVVSTGDTPFFSPARRMYRAAGFTEAQRADHPDHEGLQLVEYVLSLA